MMVLLYMYSAGNGNGIKVITSGRSSFLWPFISSFGHGLVDDAFCINNNMG